MSEDLLGMLVVSIFVAVVCGLIASGIASSKNRSGGGFFLLGVLGPIAIIAAVLAAKGEPPVPVGMKAVTCPRCNALQNVDPSQEQYECWQCKLAVPNVAA